MAEEETAFDRLTIHTPATEEDQWTREEILIQNIEYYLLMHGPNDYMGPFQFRLNDNAQKTVDAMIEYLRDGVGLRSRRRRNIKIRSN